MPHHLRLLGVLVLILSLGFAGNASAQSFSNVVVFGDSLSDSGNAAAASGLPLREAASSPTPIRSPPRSSRRPSAYRVNNSLAGGPNHALGRSLRERPDRLRDLESGTDNHGAD